MPGGGTTENLAAKAQEYIALARHPSAFGEQLCRALLEGVGLLLLEAAARREREGR